jgi:predicted transcriptional regulator
MKSSLIHYVAKIRKYIMNGSLTKEQFDKEIEKGMSDVKAGRVYSADAIEAEMKRDFGI